MRRHSLLAEAYLRAGQTNQAQDLVDKALELDDSNPETHRAAGWVAILSGRKDEGVSEWNRVIELAPDIFLYHYEFGLVYANHLNDPATAIPSFQQAIQLYPPYIPSYTALGRADLAAKPTRSRHSAIPKSVDAGSQFEPRVPRIGASVSNFAKMSAGNSVFPKGA